VQKPGEGFVDIKHWSYDKGISAASWLGPTLLVMLTQTAGVPLPKDGMQERSKRIFKKIIII